MGDHNRELSHPANIAEQEKGERFLFFPDKNSANKKPYTSNSSCVLSH